MKRHTGFFLMALISLVVFLSGSTFVVADTVILENGNKLEGIVTREGNKYVIEFSTGTIKIPASRVRKVIRQKSELEEYYQRHERIDSQSADAHYELGIWARNHNLSRQARIEFHHALKIDSDHKKAHEALGHRKHKGRWMTRDEYMEEKGYVKYEGQWVTPEVKEARQAIARQERLQQTKERLKDKQEELEQARREIERLKRELEQMRMQNNRLYEESRQRPLYSLYYNPYLYYSKSRLHNKNTHHLLKHHRKGNLVKPYRFRSHYPY